MIYDSDYKTEILGNKEIEMIPIQDILREFPKLIKSLK